MADDKIEESFGIDSEPVHRSNARREYSPYIHPISVEGTLHFVPVSDGKAVLQFNGLWNFDSNLLSSRGSDLDLPLVGVSHGAKLVKHAFRYMTTDIYDIHNDNYAEEFFTSEKFPRSVDWKGNFENIIQAKIITVPETFHMTVSGNEDENGDGRLTIIAQGRNKFGDFDFKGILDLANRKIKAIKRYYLKEVKPKRLSAADKAVLSPTPKLLSRRPSSTFDGISLNRLTPLNADMNINLADPELLLKSESLGLNGHDSFGRITTRRRSATVTKTNIQPNVTPLANNQNTNTPTINAPQVQQVIHHPGPGRPRKDAPKIVLPKKPRGRPRTRPLPEPGTQQKKRKYTSSKASIPDSKSIRSIDVDVESKSKVSAERDVEVGSAGQSVSEEEITDELVSGEIFRDLSFLNLENGHIIDTDPADPTRKKYIKRKDRTGFGICAHNSGYVYEGQWFQGMKHGKGVVYHVDNIEKIVYQGEFVEDCVTGVGTFIAENGDRYDGEWTNGSFNGYGEYSESGLLGEIEVKDSQTYTGEWLTNVRTGLGRMQFNKGEVKNCPYYDGSWENDKFQGQGTLYIPNCILFSGDFIDGVMEGPGVCVYYDSNGKVVGKYEGGFRDGLRNGRGWYKFFNEQGQIIGEYEGRFRNDEMDGNSSIDVVENVPFSLDENTWVLPLKRHTEIKYIHQLAGFDEDGS